MARQEADMGELPADKENADTIEGLRRQLKALEAERERLLAAAAGASRQTEAAAGELEDRASKESGPEPVAAPVPSSVNGFPVVMFRQNRDLVYTWVYNSHYGYAPEGIIGKTDHDLLEAEHASNLERIKRQVFDTGLGVRTEVQADPIGSTDLRFYDLTIDPLPCAHGGIEEIAGIGVDITERKKTEQAVQSAWTFAQNVVDTVREPLIVLDDRLKVISANRSFYQTFGVTAERTEGEFLYRLGNGQWDIPPLHELLERILPENTVVEAFEVEHDFPDLGQRTMLLNARRLRQEGENAPAVLLAIEDITARKKAEQALFEERELAQITLRSIGDAAITTDASARVNYLNPVAEKLTGWPLEDARGRPLPEIFRIFNEHTRAPAADPVERALREGIVTGLANSTVLVSRSGKEYLIADTAAPIRGRSNEILGAVLIFQDVTEARGLARQVEHQAKHDALTELVNRREFERRLAHALQSARDRGRRHVLAYLDLDQFKVVNDTCGHIAGDQLLRQLADLLRSHVRDRDSLGRLGGDEFGLLLENCELEDAQRIVEAILRRVSESRFTWEGRSFGIGVSIGLIAVTKLAKSPAALLSQADVACYMAKDRGRNRVHIYRPEDAELALRHSELHSAADIRDMLESGRLELFGQPIWPLAGVVGDTPADHYEILLRFNSPEGQLILPGTFIPAAERYNLMSAIDRWVIRATFEYCARNRAQLPKSPAMRLSVNLSGDSLNDDSLLDFIRQQLDTFDVTPSTICFEITETAAIARLSQTVDLMKALKAIGCRFALDDFGAGLSSLRYLKLLPVDYLKFDGSFVQNIVHDAVDHAIIEAAQRIGRSLGIQTVAEWVEDMAIVDELRALGVNYGQGFALGGPEPLDTIVWAPPSSS
jgi:diguanylate cyclase (GGDEF)-like protein/PAS domain S-box-containing protein